MATKLELQQALAAQGKELEAARQELSTLRADVARLTRQIQGNLAAPVRQHQVRMAGVLCNVVMERVGQRTIKRFIPA